MISVRCLKEEKVTRNMYVWNLLFDFLNKKSEKNVEFIVVFDVSFVVAVCEKYLFFRENNDIL